MSIPAEKLNIMMEELLNKSSESAKELNIISLEEYKKLNADQVDYLNFLKNVVLNFNKLESIFLELHSCIELIYLLTNDLKMPDENKAFKGKLQEINNEHFILNTILNDVKKYPNPRLKKSSLKLNEKIYKSFLRAKNRLLEIENEIEQYDFAPQKYMNDALKNIEYLLDKYWEYKDNPEAFLDILEYYYASDDELEWTEEDREFVAKNYA